MTGDQRHKNDTIGQRVSRHSLPALLYFLFSPPHIFLIQFYYHFTNGTFGFARHTNQPFAKPKEPFFANALNKVTGNINLKLANFQRLLLKTETVKNHNYVGRQ